jgi:hypothetical protein
VIDFNGAMCELMRGRRILLERFGPRRSPEFVELAPSEIVELARLAREYYADPRRSGQHNPISVGGSFAVAGMNIRGGSMRPGFALYRDRELKPVGFLHLSLTG